MEDVVHAGFFNKLSTKITEEDYQAILAVARKHLSEQEIKDLEEMARYEYGQQLQSLIWEG